MSAQSSVSEEAPPPYMDTGKQRECVSLDDIFGHPALVITWRAEPAYVGRWGADRRSPSVAKINMHLLTTDGTKVAVSASTGNVVHVLDVNTGKQVGKFKSGNSPHENVYSKDGSKLYHASIGYVFTPLDPQFFDWTKGERVVQVVDTSNYQVIKKFNMADKLKAAGLGKLSPAVRPMAHTPDEKFFYFQLSFLHGFVEYDMVNDKVTRLAKLPNLVPDLPLEQYVNDSAHHGIAMNAAGTKLCVAGTMDDYVAVVDRATFGYQLLQGLGQKPYWVTSNKAGDRCYVSWSGTDQMSVIDYASSIEVARVDVGRHPQRIREGYAPGNWMN